jgi:hypothetical protein
MDVFDSCWEEPDTIGREGTRRGDFGGNFGMALVLGLADKDPAMGLGDGGTWLNVAAVGVRASRNEEWLARLRSVDCGACGMPVLRSDVLLGRG